ncbi:FISUMP domain-containing protein [Dysgonomonas sp. 25]|uniref:FISUMP domain-containing protein n=1 Tax=Dysgonomonas sp. 25 TaxID=2302933 RepID=UPI0013D26D0D|nr:FISUMP domain-containing protein [Dysgonomonas sp. 25]NDV68336.1 hypothetical protein [Dysgonomonas sp. 25]
MKFKQLTQVITAFITLTLCTANLFAQVTIGSNQAPRAGALLDLTEGATTTKGLNLPRVELTNLKPTTPAELSASIGATGNWVLNDHTGLVVYNAIDNFCGANLIYQGIYVFDGTEWQYLGQDIDAGIGMSRWAVLAGFPGVAEVKVSDADDTAKGIDTPHPTTGSAWHRDQDGNIFLSGYFGSTAGRWMITNLAATTFASSGRTGDDAQVNRAFGVSIAVPSSTSSDSEPLWCYPLTPTTSTTYDDNKRLGLLYNWAAATNGKGRYDLAGIEINATGNFEINDSEAGVPQTANIQGICPNGWHLPSDVEWTQLEQEINTNTSQYSSLVDANGTITVGFMGVRGAATNGHGKGMKDSCPTPGQSTYVSNGASNVINSRVQPGMNILLTGYFALYTRDYGQRAHLWSASGYDTPSNAMTRTVFYDGEKVSRYYSTRNIFCSVRCKKD